MKIEKEVNRKEFLKLTGLAAILGAGGPAVFELFAQGDLDKTETSASIRYGMVIDTKKCKEGCTDCISSCHFHHNVPDHAAKKDEVKWIWKEPARHLFQDRDYTIEADLSPDTPVLTLCNHCKNPSCVRVCPTQATWKRNEDGIVMMDYHRCIGCRFCMAACPYGSRSFNYRDPRKAFSGGKAAKLNPDFPTRTRGVVEKCNFCAELAGTGKDPYCVTACKEGAITFGNLNDADSGIRKLLKNNPAIKRKANLGTEPSVFYLI